jgi:peptidyl-prolyl cis-trans isomerase C
VHDLRPTLREDSAKVLVRIGDDTITLGDFAAALEHMDQFDRMRYQSPERRKELLTELIRTELLARAAVEDGLDKDPVTQQEVRAILRDAYLAKERGDGVLPAKIPPAEVRAFFDAHRADYKDPERRRISAIVLRDGASAKAALAQAKEAKSLSAFGELVRSRSVDAEARSEVPVDLAGDFGIVSPPGDPRGQNARVPEDVRKAAYEIEKANDVLDRVVVADGKHWVLRLTQVLPPHERTFEEAERVIRVKLAQDKMAAREQALVLELRKKIKVEIDEAALERVRVELPDGGSKAR